MPLTEDLADRLVATSYADIPLAATEYAKRLALSICGATLRGSREPAAGAVANYVRALGGRDEAGVYGWGFQAPVENAVLVNNTSFHCTEYEGNSYPEVVSMFNLWAPYLAIGERYRLTGKRLLAMCVVGHEVQARLCRATAQNPNSPGSLTYFSFGTFGAIAVAGGVAALLGLERRRTAMALSLAASQPGGIIVQRGSMAHFVESGWAGRAGVSAAFLAKEGVTGRLEILEMPRGVLDIWTNGRSVETSAVLHDWGNPYRVLEHAEKTIPCMQMYQHVLQVVQNIQRAHDFQASDIREVEVEINAAHAAGFDHPETPEEAKFSLPHAIAAVLSDRAPTPDSFSEERVRSSDFESIRALVKVSVNKAWAPGVWTEPHPVTVTLRSGQTYRSEAHRAHGYPPDYLTDEEFSEKFFGNTTLAGVAPDRARRLHDMILNLDALPDCRVLAHALTYTH